MPESQLEANVKDVNDGIRAEILRFRENARLEIRLIRPIYLRASNFRHADATGSVWVTVDRRGNRANSKPRFCGRPLPRAGETRESRAVKVFGGIERVSISLPIRGQIARIRQPRNVIE